jgi:hypothetical protein
VRLDGDILNRKLRTPRPPDDGFRDLDLLLIRQRDGQRKGFPWSHGQIIGESLAGKREIPDRALALERTRLGCDGALHGETGQNPDESRRASGPRREAHCRKEPKEGARGEGNGV